MKAKFKRFIRRTGVFFKRNALALVISATTVLTIAVVALSAYFSINQTPSVPSDPTNKPSTDINKPVSSTDPVVFVNPLEQINIIKDYSDKELLEDKTTGIWQTHQAIDFSATAESKVLAVYGGTIENVENSMMDGTVITLKINDNLKVVYKSLANETLVSAGDAVKAGDQLGTAGTNVTEKAEGVHLHLEVYEDGKLIDPNNYFSFTDK